MRDVKPPVAVVAGHICLDIAPAFPALDAGALSRMLTPGQLVRVGAADVHTGGCVANTGLALHRLGVQTRLIARVGDDAFAQLIRNCLQAQSADYSLVCDAESSTSYSVVIAPPGVDRIFLHNAGANEGFGESDVSDAILSGATLFHFGYPPLMNRMCRYGGAQLLTLFRRAKQFGLVTSMDMAAIDPHSEAAKVAWPSLLGELLPLIDFFLPSAEELCFMLEPSRHAQWVARAGGRDVLDALDMQLDVAPLADRLLDMGAKVAVVKCGARGMLYRTADTKAVGSIPLPLDVNAWANQQGFQRSFKPRAVISATGAGDTSIAAFLASALEGLSLKQCVQRAAAAGACCVEACDALSGIPTLPELDARIASGWAYSE